MFDLFAHDPRHREIYIEGLARTYRFYAGQRDPTDPSHITVDFDADDLRVRLHGYLLNSGSLRVELEAVP